MAEERSKKHLLFPYIEHTWAEPDWMKPDPKTPYRIEVNDEDYAALKVGGDIIEMELPTANGKFTHTHARLRRCEVYSVIIAARGVCRVTYWDDSQEVMPLETFLSRPAVSLPSPFGGGNGI